MRHLILSFCAVLLVALHPASAQTAATKLEKAERINALLGLSERADPGSRAIDDLVALLMREVAPGDPSWNPSHPKWQRLAEAMRVELVPAVQSIQAAVARMQAGMARGMAEQASDEEMDGLLRFYDSPEGQRYLAFQKDITAVLGRAQQSAARDMLLGKRPAPSTAGTEKLQARIQFIQTSFGHQMFQKMFEADRRQKRDTSGYQAIGFMNALAADAEGEALDRLRAQYGDDLTRFTAFHAGPLGSRQNELAAHAFRIAEPALRASLQEISLSAVNKVVGQMPRYRRELAAP